MTRSLVSFLALIVWVPAPLAGTMVYGAPETRSTWSVAASKFQCTLSHTIPYYGELRFERHAGRELGVKLVVERGPITAGTMRLSAVAPAWKHGAVNAQLEVLDYASGDVPLAGGRELASRMMMELEKGMFPTFEYLDWVDGRDEVRIQVSSVNYKPALAEFLGCFDTLLPVAYEDLRPSRVLFESGSASLSPQGRTTLDYLSEYLLADPSRPAVVIEGHTDNVGTSIDNLLLSERRAEAVSRYLQERGLPEERLRARYLGETRPAQSNKTPEGRSENRRVLVRIVD